MENKDNCTIGQMVDRIADSYFSRGCDSFTANYKALVETLNYLTNTQKLLTIVLEKFLGGSYK